MAWVSLLELDTSDVLEWMGLFNIEVLATGPAFSEIARIKSGNNTFQALPKDESE